MRFKVSKEDIKKANTPHELFLTNLIGNHILMAIAAGGMAGSFPWLLALVPIISFGILGYTLWRANHPKVDDSWYVKCHWQVCAFYSRIFASLLILLITTITLGWVGVTYYGMMEELVLALIGGVGLLPVMVTFIILVLIESDALYHANLTKLPNWVVKRYVDLNDKEVVVIE